MKLKFKLMAIAAAVVAGSSAHAALVTQQTGSSSLILVAFNQATSSYYVRDLGYTLNTFLPSGVTTLAGDGGVTGDKTPATGLTLDKTTNASFADQAAFTSWYSAQTASDVRWTLYAGDATTANTAQGVARVLVASTTALPTITNGQVRTANTGNAVGAAAFNLLNPGMGLSATGANLPVSYLNNGFGAGFASSLGTIDTPSNLYYFAATTQIGSSSTLANQVEYGNGPTSFATVLLGANGDFSYALAPVSAVPLPGAAWLMGAGLMGIGGVIRRRKAAAEQA
jgi:hypothetical protein